MFSVQLPQNSRIPLRLTDQKTDRMLGRINMTGTIKIRIHHNSGRREKVALRITSGTHISLNEEALGFKTGCFIELGESETRIIAEDGASDFSLNGNAGRSFELKVGDFLQMEKAKIEFLVLPVIEEAATRMVNLSGAVDKETADSNNATAQGNTLDSVQSPAPEDSATQMILRMAVPQRRMEDLPLPRMSRLEVRGKPELTEESVWQVWRKEKKWWLVAGAAGGLASIGVLVTLIVWPRTTPVSPEVIQEAPALAKAEAAPPVSVAPAYPLAAPTSAAAPVIAAKPVQMPARSLASTAEEAESREDQADSMPKEEFFSAVRSNDLGLARRLVESRSVDVNLTLDRGKSALHIAATKGHLAMVKYLVKKRANVNARDLNGATPLMWATYRRNEKIAQYLVKKGADLTLRREDGVRAIDVAKRYGLKAYYDFLQPPERKRSPASVSKKASKTQPKKDTSKRVTAAAGKKTDTKRAPASASKKTSKTKIKKRPSKSQKGR
ncbi:MAG: hypothetical protein A2X94_00965 [Bdellovibrionales bacterium GWB1_55_8]|nr:MAG: hypothetical protein A2X94_00965 [Bdellovibrionales bacterium GWB1_55_8]